MRRGASSSTTTCLRCARSCAPRSVRIIGSRRSSPASCRATRFACRPCAAQQRGVEAMFLTKKHLSRRTVLKAAGVSLGLPLLDAMIPAHTALAQTAAKPRLRAGFFYLPHGAIMWNTPYGKDADRWTSSGAGADYKLSPILSPLENYKRYVASFNNLENKAPQGSVHTIVPATWLSAVKPDQKATGAKMAETIDQMI